MKKPQDQITKILNERQATHGDYLSKCIFIQTIKESMRNENNNWVRLDPDMQESLDMMVHKISRILYGDPYHTDNWVDIAGYIMLVANRLQLEEEFNERNKSFRRSDSKVT
jgi:hypothetical protein